MHLDLNNKLEILSYDILLILLNEADFVIVLFRRYI